MAKRHYLPKGDLERAIWLDSFAVNFAVVAADFDFTDEDVESVANDAAMFSYMLRMVDMFTASKQARVSYKNLLRSGPDGAPLGVLPGDIQMEPPPVEVPAGIFPRITRLVQRIKNHPNYTEAVGKKLRIIGAEQTVDFTALQPELKLTADATNVFVQWVKGHADAIYIETNKGNGWQYLAIDTKSPYTDPTPFSTPAQWKYRAIYIINEKRVGMWSSEMSVNVG